MRSSTLASMLILCGSTAAIAQVTPVPGQTTNNAMTNMTNDMANPVLDNGVAAPGNEMTPPTAAPPPDNGVWANETKPKPM